MDEDDTPTSSTLIVAWADDDPLAPVWGEANQIDYVALNDRNTVYAEQLGIDRTTWQPVTPLANWPGVRACWDEHGTMAFHLSADDVESSAFRAQLRQLADRLLKEAGPPDPMDGAV